MVFSSMTFLWIFLPVVLLVNYAFSFIKNKRKKILYKNIFLLISSLIFYAWGGFYYLFLMLASIAGNYLFALWIDHENQKRPKIKKLALVLAIVFNLGLLFYFKYFNLIVHTIENIANLKFGLKEVILPIGISFFTFQAMSYTIDVYQGKSKCQKNPFIVALYVSFFPQLIAGPIVKYQDVEDQLFEREETVDKFYEGIRRFVYGLAKKVIISNVVGQIAEVFFGNDALVIGSLGAWLGIIAYTLQIYYDFSGYSDMAIGLGKMFGFEFNENFDYPYLSCSIREFWRRWHISLGSWFREYVYIPLGGNRNGKARTCFNLFIIFLLTGIWHGANYTFVLWGVIYGILIVIERAGFGNALEKNKIKIFNWLYTMFFVVILWVFFRANSVVDAGKYIFTMFNFSKGATSIAQSMSIWKWFILIVGALFTGPIQLLTKKTFDKFKTKQAFFWIEFVWLIFIFGLSIVLLVNSTFNPFIYFQF